MNTKSMMEEEIHPVSTKQNNSRKPTTNSWRRVAWILILLADVGLLAWGAMAAIAPEHLLGPNSAPILNARYEGFTGNSWSELAATSPAIPRFMTLLFRMYGIYGVAFSLMGFVSMLITVITGFYMVLAGVGWVPWILVVIGTLILARALTAPRMAAIGRALATEKGSVSQNFQNLLNDPILLVSIQTRVAIVLGIVFLKIATPGSGGSLLTIGIAIALGIASALSRLRPVRVPEASTD